MKSITILLVLVLALGLAYSQDIPMEGLVGYWKLDEGSGAIAGDSSGFGGHGELFGAVDWVEGYMGNALEFDGIDAYVDCGIGDGQFELDYGVTLSVWVNQWAVGSGEHDPWLGKGDNAYAIKHQSSNEYEFFIYDGNWTSAHAPIDSAHLYTWHHFAGTYDGYELKIYVDGVPADTVAHESVISYSEHPVSLAWNSQATDRFFNGQIDEAMIYNIPLTDEQIMQLYNVKSAVMQERNLANEFSLQQNYPNPFNPVTSISYTIPATLPVKLDVYNTLGEQVATVVNEMQSIGTHTATFDAAELPSGIYFYKLQAGDLLVEMNKMMLVK
jgi:beta-galactosidase